MGGLEKHGRVFVLDLGADENLIHPDLLASIGDCLNEVEREPAPRALVTTGSGRYYSIGLDVRWIAANPDGFADLIGGMHELFARMLETSVPTVAALNGHAFAGGALLALTHDQRVMRGDRGYFCLPEVDGMVAFTPSLSDLLAARLGEPVAHEAMTSGRRYTAEEGRERGFVDEAVSAEGLLEAAVARAELLAGKDPETYSAIKRGLHRRTIASLRDRSQLEAIDPGPFAALAAAITDD